MRSGVYERFGHSEGNEAYLGTNFSVVALVALLLARGETGEGNTGEHVAGLVLHLILELLEHLLALLHVGLHQASASPDPAGFMNCDQSSCRTRGVVHRTCASTGLQRGLDVLEGADVALEYEPIILCIALTYERMSCGEELGGKQRACRPTPPPRMISSRMRRREIVAALRVDHLEFLLL